MAKRFLINKSKAIKLFETMGFKMAKNWTTDRLQKKLNKLPEITDEDEVGEWVQGYLNRIERADEVIIKEKEVKEMAKKKKKKKNKGKGKGKKKEVESSAAKKTEKKISAKELIYRCFIKLKNKDNASSNAKKWIEETKTTVKPSTVRSWIGQWKRGKALPACAKKK